MKFMKAEAGVFFNDIDVTSSSEVYRKIEQIGRLCYKSEDKITDTSAIDFIAMLKGRKHNAMIEHHRFTLEVGKSLFKELTTFGELYKYIQYSSFFEAPFTKDDERYLVTGSARGFLEAPRGNGMNILLSYLKEIFPAMFSDYVADTDEKLLKQKIRLLSEEDIKELPYEVRKLHQTITAKFICDRGVTHEQVRHRPPSFAQESTRYCNYSKAKFGGELKYILPNWMNDKFLGSWRFIDSTSGYCYMLNEEDGSRLHGLTLVEQNYFRPCQVSEISYMNLIELGWSPQQARDILNNSLKTEIFMTADLAEWEVFFGLRDAPTAHPQMQEVAGLLHKEFIRLELTKAA